MKTCLIYGNCQIVAIKSLLSAHPIFDATYRFVDLNPVFLLTPEDGSHLKELVADVDVFIYQPVSDQYKGKELSTNWLKTFLKEEAQLISIPVAYFTGYNPELFYLKDQDGTVIPEPFPYHDRNILSLYSQGKTIRETIQAIQSEDFYMLEHCRSNLEHTLANLESREDEQKLDVNLSRFIRENFECYRLFHTFDHPSVAIVEFMAHSILQILGIEALTDDRPGFHKPEMLDDYAFPIYPSLNHHLKLQFASSPLYRCAFKLFKPRKVVESFYRFYEQNTGLIQVNLV